MTNTEVFERAIAHILQQKSPCADQDGTYLYWNPDTGERCGVGVLLSADACRELDHAAHNGISRALRCEDSGRPALAQRELAGVDIDLLQFVQDLHDTHHRDGIWLSRIRGAREYARRFFSRG